MPLDQKTKQRFCGYCGEFYLQNMEEFMVHLEVCEKECAERNRRELK